MSPTLLQHCVRHCVSDRTQFQLASEEAPCSCWICFRVSILFKMVNTKEGWSSNRPLILDGTNYNYRKAHMVAFLKSMNNNTWKEVINGWTLPTVITKNNFVCVKLEKYGTHAEDEVALINSRTSNVIYNGNDYNIFKTINTRLVLRMPGKLLKLLMRVFLKPVCQDFN